MNTLKQALLTLLFLSVTLTTGTAKGAVTYFHHDALGSVVAATDENGAVLWRENYKPYGDRLTRAVSTDEQSIHYTGKPHDDRTGLSYFGARYYDPLIGRFMGIDPVGVDPENVHSFNRYAYANNNPYKFIDPDGRAAVKNKHGLPFKSLSQTINDMAEGGGYFGPARSFGSLSPRSSAQKSKEGTDAKNAPEITKAYKRPSGATTKAQRGSVQGKPCVDCGATTPKQYADHKDPLVKEYYRTGDIDKQRMRDIDAVQPQCPTCSNKQGAELSRFSKSKKKEHGL